MSITIDLSPEVEAQLRAVATARGQDPNHYAAAALAEMVARDTTEDNERAAARAILNGRFRPEAEIAAEMRAKYHLPDLSHLSRDELAELAEAALARIDPERVAEAERQGLL